MTKIIIQSSKAPAPIGPYNQATISGNFVFTSGQIPIDTVSGKVIGSDVQEQAQAALTHLKSVIEEAGSSLEKVVKTTVFLKNMADFPKMNEIYSEFFRSDTAPARSTIEVARLPKDVLVEVEAVAEL